MLPTPNVTLTGSFVGINGQPEVGLPVTIYLAAFGDTDGNQPSVWFVGGDAFIPNAPGPIEVVTNSEGFFTATIYGNDVIEVTGGSFYLVTAQNFSASYMFASNTSYDLASAIPLSPNYQGGGSVIITAVGPQGPQGNPGTTNVPWADIQTYGGNPHKFAFNQPTAGATISSGSPNVTLGTSGALYQSLKNGQGVCIWLAGPNGPSSAPSAPTVSSPAVQGGQTITYKIVGYDGAGGLSAASSQAQVTNAPAVFSPLPVAIATATASAGVVTLTFTGQINTTIASGMTLHVVGITGAGASWNGIWTLASGSYSGGTTTVTYNVSGATGTGSLSASSTGRLSNTQPITAITRAANGVVTVTTAQPHNFQVGTTIAPTEVIIEGCTPLSLNGPCVIASTPTTTTFTVNTGVYSAVTGSVTAGSSTATVWEHIIVACPQLSGSIIGYYVYSDSYAPGSALALIGKVPLGDCNFEDYGQCFIAGYGAPAYVPTTPPSSSQAGMLATTILSGGGTTSIVLAANPSQSIGSLGAVLMYDDGPNLIAAMAAAAPNTSIGGAVLISPPTSNSDFSEYIFNSPITVPENVNIIFACGAIINEAWTFTSVNQVSTPLGFSSSATPGFGLQNFCDIHGIANPFFFLGENSGNTGGITIDGLCFTHSVNGQVSIIDSCFFTRISNCGFKSTAANTGQGNNMAVLYLGSSSLSEMEGINCVLANRFYGNGVPGQSFWSPSRLPAIWFRGSTNTALPNYNDNTAQFTFRGKHSFNGRGITFDHQYSGGNSNQGPITIGAAIWMQQGITPIITVIGDIFYGIDITNVLNDTSITPTLANLGLNTHDVSIKNCSVGLGYSVVKGNPVANLSASGNTLQEQSQLQRIAAVSFTSTASQSDSVEVPNAAGDGVPQLSALNESAALDIAAGLAFVSSWSNSTVVVSHSETSGMIFGITTTVGNQ